MIYLYYMFAAILASSAYGMVFDLKGRPLIFATLGGGIGWLVYKLLCPQVSYAVAYLVAALVVAGYAEIMARMKKLPASVFILVGMIPLVPGEGIYLTMKALVEGNSLVFMQEGRHTFGIAGALSLGILLISSLARLTSQLKQFRNDRRRA